MESAEPTVGSAERPGREDPCLLCSVPASGCVIESRCRLPAHMEGRARACSECQLCPRRPRLLRRQSLANRRRKRFCSHTDRFSFNRLCVASFYRRMPPSPGTIRDCRPIALRMPMLAPIEHAAAALCTASLQPERATPGAAPSSVLMPQGVPAATTLTTKLHLPAATARTAPAKRWGDHCKTRNRRRRICGDSPLLAEAPLSTRARRRGRRATPLADPRHSWPLILCPRC